MQAVYGSYSHDANEMYVVSWTQQGITTPRGFIRSILVTAVLGGKKTGTPSEITAKINAVVAAYSVGGQNFGIYDDSGGLTYFALPTSGSYGGVRVAQRPSFSQVDNAQYATLLNYELTLEAEYPALEQLSGAEIVQYQESITFAGGWPIRVVRPCINQGPVEQITSPQSPYQANQSGILVTLTPNPQPNGPIWPDKIVGDPQITRNSPDLLRGVFLQQAVQWSYQYASASQLVGSPTVR